MLDTPHHDGSLRYVSTLEPALGDTVTVRLCIPNGAAASSVWVRISRDGEPNHVVATIDKRTENETWWRADVVITNYVTAYRFLLAGPHRYVNQLGTFGHEVPDHHDFKLVSFTAPPKWSSNSIMYQVFPDRFARSPYAENRATPDWATSRRWDEQPTRDGALAMTEIFGGDLDGLASKAAHLKSLSVDVVYCTPVFPAKSNHRYDSTTFDSVDPLLGGDEALVRCVAELKRHGIRFLGDLTTNHAGNHHEWFLAAQADVTSEEASYFRFHKHPDDYECWFDIPSLPKLDFSSNSLVRRLIDGPGSVVAKYLNAPYSFDGWRIDVANMTGRSGANDFGHFVARTVRNTMHGMNPDAFVVAEHAHDATGDLVGDGWYSTMNYAGLTNPLWCWLGGEGSTGEFFGTPAVRPTYDGVTARTIMDSFASGVSWRTRTHNMNLLTSHDSVRFRTIVGGDTDRQIVGLGVMIGMPGIPMVFQGDEFGMTGDHNHLTRAPLPWDQSWRWDQRLLGAHRELLGLRAASDALRNGGFRWVSVGADHLLWLRESEHERVLCLARRAAGQAISIEARQLGLTPTSISSCLTNCRDLGGARLTLPGDGPAFHMWRLGA
jgi:alpha-glucosidase